VFQVRQLLDPPEPQISIRARFLQERPRLNSTLQIYVSVLTSELILCTCVLLDSVGVITAY
jgi:hypothetical protein